MFGGNSRKFFGGCGKEGGRIGDCGWSVGWATACVDTRHMNVSSQESYADEFAKETERASSRSFLEPKIGSCVVEGSGSCEDDEVVEI